MFVSLDGGKSWADFGRNMPTVAFHDLYIHPRDNDLIAGTHGRGIWIMDDISSLQELSKKVMEKDVHVFANSRPGTHWLRLSRGGYGRGNLYFAGENPQAGAPVSFYLKNDASGPVILEIADATGEKKTTYVYKDLKAGIHRIQWDMQFDPSETQFKARINMMQNMMGRILQRQEVEPEQKKVVEKAVEDMKKPGLLFREAMAIQQKAFETIGFSQYMRFGRMGRGQENLTAEPGTYAVKVTAGGKTYSSTVKGRNDPMRESGGK